MFAVRRRTSSPGSRLFCAVAAIMGIALAAGCTHGTPSDRHTSRPTTSAHLLRGDARVTVTTLVEHLDVPWGVTFLPDGGALVTERQTLRILKVGPKHTANGELTVRPVTTVKQAYSNNEGGLLGIAASPNFAQDNTVYIFYMTRNDNRIARLKLGGRPKPIVTGIPHAGVHDGGRLMFGPDGYLYATTGDASRAGHSQYVSQLGGKILRMTTDGKPAPGNPFPHSLVWSYGHRNPEGMAWDDQGQMYESEIGEALWDEINRIEPGKNYGWPKVEGMSNKPGYTNPLAAWHPEMGVTSGIAIVRHTAVVTCLRSQRIYLVDLDGSRSVSAGGGFKQSTSGGVRWRPNAGVLGQPQAALVGKYGRIRTAIKAPDGSVWLTTSNRDGRNHPVLDDDRILRLTFKPQASPAVTPKPSPKR